MMAQLNKKYLESEVGITVRFSIPDDSPRIPEQFISSSRYIHTK